MDPVTVGATITASVLGSTLLTAVVTGWLNKKKSQAEADNIIGDAYGSLIKNLRDQIDNLQNEFMFLKEEHKSCRKENENLLLRIEKLERKK